MSTVAAPELTGYTELKMHKSVKLRLTYIALHRDKPIFTALAEIVDREFELVRKEREDRTQKD